MEENNDNDLKPVKHEIERNPDGTWKKGFSGNPNGSPQALYNYHKFVSLGTRLLDKYSVDELKSVYEDKECLKRLRVDEACIIARMVNMIERDGLDDFIAFWDRMIGKPVQRQELTGQDGSPLPIGGHTFVVVGGEKKDPVDQPETQNHANDSRDSA